jgi:hypothetical protein
MAAQGLQKLPGIKVSLYTGANEAIPETFPPTGIMGDGFVKPQVGSFVYFCNNNQTADKQFQVVDQANIAQVPQSNRSARPIGIIKTKPKYDLNKNCYETSIYLFGVLVDGYFATAPDKNAMQLAQPAPMNTGLDMPAFTAVNQPTTPTSATSAVYITFQGNNNVVFMPLIEMTTQTFAPTMEKVTKKVKKGDA